MTIPKHIALIPDGNRTRAKKHNKSTKEAYRISYQKGVEMIDYTFNHTKIKIFTLRGLSTENSQKRPAEELDFLMNMYKKIDNNLDKILAENKVNFKRIGNPDGITEGFKKYLQKKSKKLKFNTDKYFIFAINYGGRDEILRGIKNLAKSNYDLTKINEKNLTKHLDLGNITPIELVIRTKGNLAHRTSGFMSRWIGYAELYFSKKKCPEFSVKHYKKALKRFNKKAQQRNFGK